MARIEWLFRLTLVGVLAYGAITLSNVQHERFPIFTWSLFSKVPPATSQDYSVRFTEIDGRPLDPPAYFPTLKGTIRTANSPSAYSLMRRLGADLDLGRPRAGMSRALFEDAHLGDLESARYQVMYRRFDQKRRFACEQAGRSGADCFLEERMVGEFVYGG
jgi:hypothetical protein